MNYPFQFQIIGRFADQLEFTFIEDRDVIHLWQWDLIPISCPVVEQWISTFEDLYTNQINLSVMSQSSNWHIDQMHSHMVCHRVLIPLSDNFSWEWNNNGNIITHKAEKNAIYLFNNMIKHRVVCSGKRECIFFNLFDKKFDEYLTHLTGKQFDEYAYFHQ